MLSLNNKFALLSLSVQEREGFLTCSGLLLLPSVLTSSEESFAVLTNPTAVTLPVTTAHDLLELLK